MEKTKVVIAGIGAVGGFFGGKLAKYYHDNKKVEIYFLTRGENEKAIKDKGLRVESVKETFTAYPKLVTSDPSEIGFADFILCCTKSYDLNNLIHQLKPCIGKSTVILPVMNGVDFYEKLEEVLPKNEIWMGCTYIVSRLERPGIVRETGNISKLMFGSLKGDRNRLKNVFKLFKDAGIDTEIPDNIESVVWEKYFFISTVATATSYFDASVGDLLSKSNVRGFLNSLFTELSAVARAKGIKMQEDIVDKTVKILKSLPPEATSSMHTDFKKGNKTEVDSLTGYVVKTGAELNLPVAAFEEAYRALKAKKSYSFEKKECQ